MRVLLAGLVLLVVGCLPARPTVPLPQQTELEQLVARAGLDAWREAGLELTAGAELMSRLRIERRSPEWLQASCRTTVSCLGWLDQGEVPVAYVSDELGELHVARAALHEVLHGIGYRAGRWGGGYDSPTLQNPRGHTDTAVWAGPGGSRPDSVEQRAQRALDGLLMVSSGR